MKAPVGRKKGAAGGQKSGGGIRGSHAPRAPVSATGTGPPAGKLHAGTLTGAYGIKGWVRVHALTDPLENFLSFPAFYIASQNFPGSGTEKTTRVAAPTGHRSEVVKGSDVNVLAAIAIEAGRRHGRGLVVKFAGIDDRTTAEQLRGTQVWVDASELARLDDGEFYWHELVGLRVWARQHCSDRNPNGLDGAHGSPVLLGIVDHLLETGANDVLVLAPCEGSLDQRERLVPYLPGDVVDEVDLPGGRIDVLWHPDD